MRKYIIFSLVALLLLLPMTTVRGEITEKSNFVITYQLSGDEGAFTQVKQNFDSTTFADVYKYISLRVPNPGDQNDTILKFIASGEKISVNLEYIIRYRNVTPIGDPQGYSQYVFFGFSNATGSHILNIAMLDKKLYSWIDDDAADSKYIVNVSTDKDTVINITSLQNGLKVQGNEYDVGPWKFEYIEFTLSADGGQSGNYDPPEGYILKNIIITNPGNGEILYDAHSFGPYYNDYGVPNSHILVPSQNYVNVSGDEDIIMSKFIGYKDSDSIVLQSRVSGRLLFEFQHTQKMNVSFDIMFTNTTLQSENGNTIATGQWIIAPGITFYGGSLHVQNTSIAIQPYIWYHISIILDNKSFFLSNAGLYTWLGNGNANIYVDNFRIETDSGIVIKQTNNRIDIFKTATNKTDGGSGSFTIPPDLQNLWKQYKYVIIVVGVLLVLMMLGGGRHE